MADRKVDELIPSNGSLADRLRRRRNAIEAEPSEDALEEAAAEGAGSRTDTSLRRKEDSGRYDGTEDNILRKKY